MIERLRNAFLALMTEPATEDDQDKCPKCGGKKLIDVTTVDVPVGRQQMLCQECNFTWRREARE